MTRRPPDLWPSATLARTRPGALANHRDQRFRGEALHASLASFTDPDVVAVRTLYDWLGALESASHVVEGDRASACAAVDALLTASPVSPHVHAMQEFGRSITRDRNSHLAKVIHDVRGGALTSLLMHLRQCEVRGVAPEDLLSLFVRVRDHRKILRGTLTDLDADRRARDTELRQHDVRLLVEKWSDATVLVDRGGVTRAVTVRLDAHFDGGVSESCVEFSALDRVLYNVLNNATRHAADDGVHAVLTATPDDAPAHLHVAVANRVSDGDVRALRARFGDDLGALFFGGYSATGSGLGLRICADMVGNAYGLDDPEEAVDGGYLGALLEGDVFGVWFHWPLVAD